MRGRPWITLLITLGVGIVLFIGGFAYAVVTGVAIPDQDPTPEMVEYARFHDRIAQFLVISGLLLAVGSILASPVLLVYQLWTRRRRV